jgi:hypothetical protein
MSVIETSIKQISDRGQTGFLRAIAEFLADFQRTVFDTYQPERHYMRGPGPACAAKRARYR